MQDDIFNGKEADISYPCAWDYLVITSSEDTLSAFVRDNFANREYSFKFSKASKEGAYLSFVFSTIVFSKNERDEIFRRLSKISGVKMVI